MIRKIGDDGDGSQNDDDDRDDEGHHHLMIVLIELVMTMMMMMTVRVAWRSIEHDARWGLHGGIVAHHGRQCPYPR